MGENNKVKKITITTNSRYLRLLILLTAKNRFQILHLRQENEVIVVIIADPGILMRCMTKHESVNQFFDCRLFLLVVSIVMGRIAVLFDEILKFLDETFWLVACSAELLNHLEGFREVDARHVGQITTLMARKNIRRVDYDRVCTYCHLAQILVKEYLQTPPVDIELFQ